MRIIEGNLCPDDRHDKSNAPLVSSMHFGTAHIGV
jgi:hypothetical protein